MDIDRFDELMREAASLDNCDAQVAMFEEAVRIADSIQDNRASIKGRLALIEAATFGGYPEKALVAFSWCLPMFDAEPDLFCVFDFLWMSFWILGTVDHNPANSLETIHHLFNDVEKRFIFHNYSIRGIIKIRAHVATAAGLDDKALDFIAQWKSASRDGLGECVACGLETELLVNANAGRLKDAVQVAEPLLLGDIKCDVIPTLTYGCVLEPLLRLKRYEEAKLYNRKGQRLVNGKRGEICTTAEHLRYRTHIREFPQAIRMLESNLQFSLETTSWSDKFDFYLSTMLLLESLIRRGTRKHRKLRLPRNFELWNDESKYDLAKLHDWFHNNTLDIAAKFDKRNRTTRYADRIESVRELVLSDPAA